MNPTTPVESTDPIVEPDGPLHHIPGLCGTTAVLAAESTDGATDAFEWPR